MLYNTLHVKCYITTALIICEFYNTVSDTVTVIYVFYLIYS